MVFWDVKFVNFVLMFSIFMIVLGVDFFYLSVIFFLEKESIWDDIGFFVLYVGIE